MEIPNNLPQINRRTVLISLVVILFLSSLGIFISGPSEQEPESAEFSLEYTNSQVSVTQTQGEVSENAEVRISYVDGETENLTPNLSDTGSSVSVTPSRPIGEISQSSVVYQGEVRAISELPDNLEPSGPNIENIENRTIQIGSQINISASDFVNSSVSINSYEWEMGDGNSYSQDQVSHEYSSTGEYDVNVTAVDVRGNSANRKFTISVEQPEEPVDLIQVDQSLSKEISMDTVYSIDARDFTSEDVNSYNWSMGDGTEYQTPEISHQYEESGSYQVSLEVTSSETSESETYEVTVEEVSVTSNIQVVDISELQVVLSAQGTETEGNIKNYAWSFGDGNSENSSIPEIEYMYNNSGTYTVTLTTTTDSGSSSTTTQKIEVGNSTGTTGGNDDNDDDDGQDTDGDGSGSYPGVMIDAEISASNSGYVFESVSPSARTDEILATSNTGSENPEMHLEVGNRYSLDIGDTAFEHPLAIVDEDGQPLLSMADVGEMETNQDVNWVERGNTIKFTVTQDLINRSSGYQSDNDETFGGDIIQYEEVDIPENLSPDVTIVLDNDRKDSWRVSDVSGELSYEEVVPDAVPSDPNPTIHLQTGLRYRFEGIPDGGKEEEDLNLAFYDIVGDPLLSQSSDGRFETDQNIAWENTDTRVDFTLTDELSGDIENYVETSRERGMSGDIVID